ncbi:UvrD-helicase domain-containing protein [Clostridium guangxiense]|uniref:UvrD-helicase domain-containing protein n=1 Tax=Clostridium guangxiense TaxID=1662055 RepID=UPI001E4878D3|nr:UvrD-helicase domain-containing protein [Clostridium guangxiense]MCD2348242.1 UvrD-helicase domain-containing protein [Clostridium guangxiense]
MSIGNKSTEFFTKLSRVWQNFKDYSYLEGINLSPEQISIIEQGEEQLLIEGYAGTGKSLTLLYKFINVLVREEGEKILFVTYNSTLIEDTKKRLETSKEYLENKDKHIAHVMTFHEMATKILKQIRVIGHGVGRLDVEKIKKYQGDSLRRIAAILARYTEKTSETYKNLPSEERLYSTHTMNFVTEEIAWIKAMGFVELDKYLSTERTGRSKSIRLTRNQRKTIFKIYKEYQRQLESYKYGEMLDLEDYALKMLQNSYLLNDEIKYDYIFVDEVQDLDPMQIKALCKLTKKSIVLSGDAKQKIYNKCPVKYEDIGLMIRQKGRRRVLNKNYRSTAEIVTLANSLDFYDSQDKLATKQFVKHGEKPVIRVAKEGDTAIKYIVSEIKKIFYEDSSKNIAIIHREEVKKKTGYKSPFRLKLEELLMQSMADMNTYSYKFNYKKDKQIFYTNAYDVKGLEFDVVFIVDFNTSFYPHSSEIKKIKESNENKDESLINEDILEFINTEKKLLYVAMTRAKEKLYLIANNCKMESQISEFIYDFDHKDYVASGFTKKKIEELKQKYRIVGNGKLYRLKEKEKEPKLNEDMIKEIEEGIELEASLNDEDKETKYDTNYI